MAPTLPLWIPLALVAIPAWHVLLAPYTKVEESFSIHAAHDVLRYGLGPTALESWDHRTFPGAVPRSFLPPILLALASWPLAVIANLAGLTRTSVDVQILVRLVLAFTFSGCYAHLTRTLWQRYGPSTAKWFVILSLVQFHVPYYAGRTLPNFTAFPFVVLALSFVLRERYFGGIALLTAVATIVRLELALFVVPLALNLVILRRVSLLNALTAGVVGGVGALLVAAPIDYTLWAPVLPHPQLPGFTRYSALWPELSAMVFNVVDGHADEWGVEPASFYAKSLAKMLAGALPLVNLGVLWTLMLAVTGADDSIISDKILRRSVGEIVRVFGPPTATLIACLTTVGHKEWRFIVYVMPVFNMVAGATAAAFWRIPHTAIRTLARLAVLGLVAATAAITVFSTYVSTHNYPGGELWRVLDTLNIPAGASIHFPSYPLQTGATLFTFTHAELSPALAFPSQEEPAWVYSKDEAANLLTPAGAWVEGIDYVVTHNAPGWTAGHAAYRGGELMWREVAAVSGFKGLQRGGKYVVQVVWDKKLSVLQRLEQ